MSNTIEIPVDIQYNTVICGRNGGNARGCREDRIVWSSRSPHAEFTLRFFPLGLENAGATELEKLFPWPFEEPRPHDGIVSPRIKFVGTLRHVEEPLAFKYTIAVGNWVLDPIIIVDKKT